MNSLLLKTFFQFFDQYRDDLIEITHYPVVGGFKNRGVLIAINCEDNLTVANTGYMLNLSGNPDANIEIRLNLLSGYAHVYILRKPAQFFGNGSGTTHLAPQNIRQVSSQLDIFFFFETTANADDDLCLRYIHSLTRPGSPTDDRDRRRGHGGNFAHLAFLHLHQGRRIENSSRNGGHLGPGGTNHFLDCQTTEKQTFHPQELFFFVEFETDTTAAQPGVQSPGQTSANFLSPLSGPDEEDVGVLFSDHLR